MAEQIHGHEVMRMMIDSGQSYTRDSLRTAIHERFGAATRFYTCVEENLTGDGLVEFLAQRGKLVDRGDGFTTDSDMVCEHDEEH